MAEPLTPSSPFCLFEFHIHRLLREVSILYLHLQVSTKALRSDNDHDLPSAATRGKFSHEPSHQSLLDYRQVSRGNNTYRCNRKGVLPSLRHNVTFFITCTLPLLSPPRQPISPRDRLASKSPYRSSISVFFRWSFASFHKSLSCSRIFRLTYLYLCHCLPYPSLPPIPTPHPILPLSAFKELDHHPDTRHILRPFTMSGEHHCERKPSG